MENGEQKYLFFFKNIHVGMCARFVRIIKIFSDDLFLTFCSTTIPYGVICSNLNKFTEIRNH